MSYLKSVAASVNVILVVVAGFALTACMSMKGSAGPSTPVIADVYLPYVEAVEISSPVYVGVDVMVTLRLSAEGNPGVLNGLQDRDDSPGSWVRTWQNWSYKGPVTIHPWVMEPLASGPPVAEHMFNIGMYIEPGTYELYIQTAAARELGGAVTTKYASDPLNSYPPEHDQAVLMGPFEITVLPAE